MATAGSKWSDKWTTGSIPLLSRDKRKLFSECESLHMPCWKRLCGLTGGGLTSLAEQFCTVVDGASVRHLNTDAFAKLDYRTHKRFKLHRPASFEVLQHGSAVFTDFFRPRHPLIDGDRQFHAELVGHSGDFFHDTANDLRDAGIAQHLSDRCACKCAQWI